MAKDKLCGFCHEFNSVEYIKQCQSDGYVIIDLQCRDF